MVYLAFEYGRAGFQQSRLKLTKCIKDLLSPTFKSSLMTELNLRSNAAQKNVCKTLAPFEVCIYAVQLYIQLIQRWDDLAHGSNGTSHL